MKSSILKMRSLILAIGFIAPVIAGAVEPSQNLTLHDAISRAIQTNLNTQLAKAATQEARGRTIQAAASLLPQVTGSVSQTRTFKSNLAALGFSAGPFLPNPVIGPYNTFDARIQLVQSVLDLNSVWMTKQASANSRAAKLQETLAEEQVASAAALAYFEGVRSQRSVQDAQANLDLSNSLARLAHQQHDAGTVTGVDVARAETHAAEDQQNLIQAKLAATHADLRLKRVVGIPLATSVTLVETSSRPFVSEALEGLLAKAQSDRLELGIARERVKAESYGVDAARADFLPTLDLRGDYGFSGNEPQGSARTGSIGAGLRLPIFSGGETRGSLKISEARRSASQNQLDDVRLQVEEDVRLSLTTLAAEAEGVTTAERQVTLAERELSLAKDRYSAGVGDNIQVVSAQTSLAGARQSRVNAWARYSDAQANLAMALGHMRHFN